MYVGRKVMCAKSRSIRLQAPRNLLRGPPSALMAGWRLALADTRVPSPRARPWDSQFRHQGSFARHSGERTLHSLNARKS
jgi:hypothetical protein